MKTLIILAMPTLALSLTGCLAGYDDGRQAAHKEIRVAEETTTQKFLETKKAEVEADKNKRQNPTLKITNYAPDGITVSSMIEADVAPSIEAATGGKKYDSNYGADLARSKAPVGEVAENLDAGGRLIVGAASSPGGVVYATAKGVSRGIKESGGGGTHIVADEANISGSYNQTDSTNIGSGSSAATATATGTNNQKEGKSSSGSSIDPQALADCRTTANGPASIDETNACLVKDYGYETTIQDGVIYLDGKPI